MSKSQDAEIGAASMPPPGTEPPPMYQASYGGADAVPPTYTGRDNTESDAVTLEMAGTRCNPPPSYDSLFGQVRAARQESTGFVQFFKKFLMIILSTIGCTVIIALVIAVPLSMIVIGSIYFGKCPREHYIPIYLIVGGSFGILKNLSNIVQRVKGRLDDDEDNEQVTKTNPFDGTLNCFLMAWFIAGNVWIYRIYGDFTSDDPDSAMYCHHTLYWFAFWITTATYIFAATLCCCICCCGLLASCFKAGSE